MMETKEYKTIDRVALGWPKGEWDNEPDKVQWPDPDTGLPCLAVRHRRSGHWCGYVGVSESHPFFQKDYEAPSVEVHGGLTFADMCHAGNTEAEGVCHIPAAGEPAHVWWFGFDCAHAWDYSPSDMKRYLEGEQFYKCDSDSSYKTLAYVKYQCASLASQLSRQQDQRHD